MVETTYDVAQSIAPGILVDGIACFTIDFPIAIGSIMAGFVFGGLVTWLMLVLKQAELKDSVVEKIRGGKQ